MKPIFSMIALVASLLLSTLFAHAAEEVTAVEAAARLQADPSIVVLDIRTPREFSRGHIPGAINIDFYARDFRTRIAQLDPEKTYIMHCAVGGRSDASISIMQNAGLPNVLHMGGGVMEWYREGLPLTR